MDKISAKTASKTIVDTLFESIIPLISSLEIALLFAVLKRSSQVRCEKRPVVNRSIRRSIDPCSFTNVPDNTRCRIDGRTLGRERERERAIRSDAANVRLRRFNVD